jgi:hypothetical protein
VYRNGTPNEKGRAFSVRVSGDITETQAFDTCDCRTIAEYIENHGEDMTLACLSYGMDLHYRAEQRKNIVARWAMAAPVSHSMRGKHSKR